MTPARVYPPALPGSRSSLVLVLAFLFLLVSPTIALPAPSPSPSVFTDWLRTTFLPEKGTTIADEIKCYGLPYGAIGNLSHVLTYWTLGCLFFYRAPWLPWFRLRSGGVDLTLGLIQLITSAGIASLTISRCRDRWQFLLFAVGRLQFSLTMGYCAVHTSITVMNSPLKQYILLKTEGIDYPKLYFLPWLVHLCALPNLAALGSVLKELWTACDCTSADACQVCQDWKASKHLPITTISWAFMGSMALLLLIFAFYYGRKKTYKSMEIQNPGYRLHVVVGIGSLLVALWCDWILAVVADNITGAPSGDLAILYWAYFGAKRLPMLFS